jgi:putative tryptophan/tyrosine transport system substrate-binding protein
MRRRDFITLLGSAAAWPLAARAQDRMALVGFIGLNSAGATQAYVVALLDGLKQAGYIEGRNLAMEYRFAEGRIDRLPALAADLVQRQVQAIVTQGTPTARAAKGATSTIPIVFEVGTDPVQAGIVASINRPGGNITGVTNIAAALAAKRLELLHALVPHSDTIGIVNDPIADTSTQATDLQDAARALGLKIMLLNASNDQEIDAAFATIVRQRIEALLLAESAFLISRREQLVALARFNAVPTMYTFPEFVRAGGLISYGASVTDAWHRAGAYVGRVLRGEKPGDLPVQAPTKYELVINLKTAKALGLEVPPTLIALADDLID